MVETLGKEGTCGGFSLGRAIGWLFLGSAMAKLHYN
jgi:hypothetical protein